MWKSTVLFDAGKYFSLVLRTTIAFQSAQSEELCPLSAKKVSTNWSKDWIITLYGLWLSWDFYFYLIEIFYRRILHKIMNLFDILNMLNRHTITSVGSGRWSFVTRNSATWGVACFMHSLSQWALFNWIVGVVSTEYHAMKLYPWKWCTKLCKYIVTEYRYPRFVHLLVFEIVLCHRLEIL